MEIFSGCGQIYNEARPVLKINSWLFKLSCSRRIHFCCPFHVLIICPGAERLRADYFEILERPKINDIESVPGTQIWPTDFSFCSIQ